MTSSIKTKKITNEIVSIIIDEPKTYNSLSFKNLTDLLNTFKKLDADKKIKVIGINYKDNEKKTIKWLKELGNPYSSIALDKDGRIAIEWGVYGIPETFVISSKNIIKYRQAGPITKNIYKKINNIIKNIE